jgi:dTDP-4-amino-4,6-dideoxygalactose transaminase
MPVSASIETQIPLVNLKAQFEAIKGEVVPAVMNVLESCHYVNGEWIAAFEQNLACYVGARHAIAVRSGTAALELALKAAQIGPGAEVIVPANSFFATAEAVSNVGALPCFVDVDARTFHLDLESVERAISQRTRAILLVHLYGRAMDLSGLEELAARRGIEIIEDAAQVLGAGRNGAKVGLSGRLTCFSFYPGKNLGAIGEAGAVTCNDAKQAAIIRLLREHGSPSKYEHSIVGTNSRMDSIQAAVLDVKLKHLDEWNSKRQQHAAAYIRAFKNSPVISPSASATGEHNFHLFVIRVQNRDGLKRHLEELGIAAGIHYPIPLHRTEAYRRLGYNVSLPVAEQLSKEILSLPMFPELTGSEIDYVAGAVLEFVRALQPPCTF